MAERDEPSPEAMALMDAILTGTGTMIVSEDQFANLTPYEVRVLGKAATKRGCHVEYVPWEHFFTITPPRPSAR